jgi:hypothetical protein
MPALMSTLWYRPKGRPNSFALEPFFACNVHHCQGPARRGVLFMVFAMLEIVVFFEDQVKECNLLAERASDESGREFWRLAARRWGALLGERRGQLDVEVRLEHPHRRKRCYLRKQQRRAA